MIDGRTVDPDRPAQIDALLDRTRPWAVVNAAVRADHSGDKNPRRDAGDNGDVALARACATRGIASLAFCGGPAPEPTEEQAHLVSDAAMEPGRAGRALIVRAGMLFSPDDADSLAVQVLAALDRGDPFTAEEDRVVTPTFVPALVEAALDLLIDEATGNWHLTHGEAIGAAEFARRIAIAGGYDPQRIRGVATAKSKRRAPRSPMATLGNEQVKTIGTLQPCIDRFANEIAARAARSDAA